MEAAYIESPIRETVVEFFTRITESYPDGGALILLAEQSGEQVEEVQQAAQETGCPIIGAIFPALVANGDFQEMGAVVLPFSYMPSAKIVDIADAASAPEQAVERIQQSIDLPATETPKTLFMIFDAMIGNISTLLDKLYLKLSDKVHYAGINAGSETFQPMPCLFDNEKLTGNAVLALLLEDYSGVSLAHGYSKTKDEKVATSSTGNKVTHIDWIPALDSYRELAKAELGVSISPENFYENAVHFPFGIVRLDGEVIVRIPVALEEDGSMFCVGEVPENSMLSLLQAPESASRETVELLANQLEGDAFDTLLTFYCAGRRMHMGEKAVDELKLLEEQLPQHTTLLGALSLGEIGDSGKQKYPLFHNAAIVCCPWPRN